MVLRLLGSDIPITSFCCQSIQYSSNRIIESLKQAAAYANHKNMEQYSRIVVDSIYESHILSEIRGFS